MCKVYNRIEPMAQIAHSHTVHSPQSELTTDKLADIEYGNYCWHCNACTSIFPISGINDAELIDGNVAYENSYDLAKTHMKLSQNSVALLFSIQMTGNMILIII